VLTGGGFPLDDAWIHQVIGRNIATADIWKYAGSAAASGSSSTIWPLIVSLNYSLFDFVSASTYLLALNTLFYVIVLYVLFIAAMRDRLARTEIAILVGLPAATGNFVWLITSGMEHLLFISSAFLAARVWLFAARRADAARPGLAGMLCGLAILARPEAVTLIPVFLVAAALTTGTSRRTITIFLIPCALAIALVLLDDYLTANSLLPATLAGRRWLAFGVPRPSPLGAVLALLGQWRFQIMHFFLGIWPGDLAERFILFACFILLTFSVMRLVRCRAANTLVLVSLMLTNFATYCVLMPTSGQGMRYQSMALIFVFPLTALGGLEIIERSLSRFRHVARGSTVVNVALLSLFTVVALRSLYIWHDITRDSIRHINGTEVAMGHWLAKNLAPGVPIASFDIGGIGFFGVHPIVDLGGLTDPEFVPYLYARRAAAYLRSKHVTYLIVPSAPPGVAAAEQCQDFLQSLALCDSATMHKVRVVEFHSPDAIWRTALAATNNAYPAQVLYAIIWR
jgi:hypothetical protein